MTTTVEELERWMNVPEEYENLEFKEAKSGFHSERVLKYCVALSNEGGGKLILGVTNERPRKVVGTQAANYPPGTQKKILDTLHFLVRVEQVKHPDGRVVIFHIPTRDRGTARQHEGAYWMRSGEELKPMTPERLREIFDEGGPDWFMRPAREGCSAADVVRLLDTRIYFDLTKQPYPTDRDGEIARFESEKLISEDEAGYSITNLGAVLFAKRLDEFEGLGRKAPRFIVYDGPSKLKVLRDNPGTKGYVVGFQGLLEFISNQIPSNEFIGKAFRAEIFKMFPDDALRELVANALIHQDFTATGSSVMIELYSDRLEISNPGKPSISPERFIDEYRSRNEKLADLMRRLGICEERGAESIRSYLVRNSINCRHPISVSASSIPSR